MAKRVVKWSLKDFVLSASKALENNEQAKIDFDFDVEKLFPGIKTMNEVQQNIILFGVRQKLMDTGSSEVANYEGKLIAAKETWKQLCEGKWTGERINSTGAAENKRIAGAVKEVLKTVSLESLLIKKTLYPSTFTADDAEKLQEFMQRAATSGK